MFIVLPHSPFAEVIDIYPISAWLPVALELSQQGSKLETTTQPSDDTDYYGSYASIDDKGRVLLHTQIVDLLNTEVVHVWCDMHGCISFCDTNRYRVEKEHLANERESIKRFIAQKKA
jgi:hypothetical protein